MTTSRGPAVFPTLPGAASGSFRQLMIETGVLLRTELTKLVNFQGRGARRAATCRSFGVDFQLSWKIYRVVNSSNPIEACLHIPPPPAMQRLLAAARRHEVSDDVIAGVEAAYTRFEQLVEYFSGDRNRFDSMAVRLIGGEADTQAELAHRRSIFEGNRYILGVELDTYLTADIIHPSKKGANRIDYAGLRLKRQFRRLSSDAPFVVERRRVRNSISPQSLTPATPLDDEAFKKYGIPVLPAFCSMPDLPLQSVEEADGTTITKWLGGSVGCPSAIDVTFGEVWRDLPLRERPENRFGLTTSTTFSTPTRVFAAIFFFRDRFMVRPCATLPGGGRRWNFRKRVEPLEEMGLPKLTFHDRLTYVGDGTSAAHSVEVPQYGEALRSTCKLLGWDLEDMDVYRVRVEYPLIFTLLVLSMTFMPSEK